MKLTLEILESICTPQSFERAEEYYFDDLVSKLVKNGDEYKAEIWGSRPYNIWIDLGGQAFQATCSCPYDYAGACKHIIAVGLAIIEEDVSEMMTEIVEEVPDTQISSQTFFKEYYQPTHAAQKEAFWQQLLEKNENLRAQFVQFLELGKPQTVRINIDGIRDQVFKVLSKLEDEWETAEEVSSTIRETLVPFRSQLQVNLSQDRADEALRILLGIYEGMYQVSFHYSEETPFDDEEIKFKAFSPYNQEIIAYLNRAVISPVLAKEMIQLIFKRWDKYEQAASALRSANPIHYQLSLFQPMLMALISDPSTAQAARTQVEGYHIEQEGLASLYLHIADLQQDLAYWLENAQKFALTDQSICRQLLNHYEEANNHSDFLALAKQAFKQWPDTFGAYLLPMVNQALAPAFYIELLKYLAANQQSLDLYLQLKSVASQAECESFVQAQKNKHHYYIQLLEYEKAHAALLDFAREHEGAKNLTLYLSPILNVYPQYCHQQLAHRVHAEIKEKKNRSVYQRVCGLLALMLKIDTFKTQTKTIIQDLYSQRLTSLKDEMRKAKIV